MQFRLLSLLEKVLNQTGNIYKNDDVAFHCPACNLENHKKKLIVNLNENSSKFGYWRCWNCKDYNGMHGRNLIKLFKKINASQADIVSLYEILDLSTITKNINDSADENKTDINVIKLPKEFISLTHYQNTDSYKKAIDFLLNRDISRSDIIKYNIGYCDSGKYKNRIIIPSYSSDGKLNYFISRSFDPSIKPKYLKPPIDLDSGIIFFDMHINWSMPIILCEGVFDAIAAKRNAIPVLGNSIYGALWKKIIFENVKDIILALDMDVIKTSLHYIEKFIAEGINVKFIEMNKKDPSELGFKKFIELYNNSNSIDFSELINLKLKYL